MQMENHADFHSNIMVYIIINVRMKMLKILIIKNGVVQMMIQQLFLNGEIVHVNS
jgi:hypothetical protein